MSNFNPYVPNPLAGTGDIPKGAMGVIDFAGLNGTASISGTGTSSTSLRALDSPGASSAPTKPWCAAASASSMAMPMTARLSRSSASDSTMPGRRALRFPRCPQRRRGSRHRWTIPMSALTPTFGDRGTAYPLAVVQYLDPHRKTPYSMNFNLTIQHQWKGILFEIGGLGNLGRQADFGNINMNHIPPNLLSQTQIQERLRRPLPSSTASRRRCRSSVPTGGSRITWH